MITGHPSLPANSLKELIALAKKQPGKLRYASAGIGTFPHLGGELFKLTAGIDLLHVPFKGSAPALIDVVIGQNTRDVFDEASARQMGKGFEVGE